jgi:hypothetical protein
MFNPQYNVFYRRTIKKITLLGVMVFASIIACKHNGLPNASEESSSKSVQGMNSYIKIEGKFLGDQCRAPLIIGNHLVAACRVKDVEKPSYGHVVLSILPLEDCSINEISVQVNGLLSCKGRQGLLGDLLPYNKEDGSFGGSCFSSFVVNKNDIGTPGNGNSHFIALCSTNSDGVVSTTAIPGSSCEGQIGFIQNTNGALSCLVNGVRTPGIKSEFKLW